MSPDYTERAVTAIHELRKWEQKKADLEKMLAAIRRKKKAIRRRIAEIDSALDGYPEERPEVDGSTAFPAGRQ